MKPLLKLQKSMTEKKVMLSVVRPLNYKVLTKFLLVNPQDSHVKKEIKKEIKTDLEKSTTKTKKCWARHAFLILGSNLSEVESRIQVQLKVDRSKTSPRKAILEDLMNSPLETLDNPSGDWVKKEIQQYNR